ncbi:MAG: hypothetical protein HY749_07315 [Gammaproteobacteria bacterium]|nr:hypothetical protein [Gammaproteobacteria bacterium]MBI5615779.1 hypothetical protein [Gammaproteobacteria bacterium]
MAGETYDIVYAGRIAEGTDAAQVQANVAKLFKTEPAKVQHLFTGQRVFVKKGVDDATARQYVAAFGKAGALAEIVPAAVPPPAPAAITPALREPAAAPAPNPLPAQTPGAPPRASGPAAPPPAALRGTPAAIPEYTVAEPGVVLVEAVPVAPTQIDTAHLSLAEVGADLGEPSAVTVPQYDLSALTLDPPGVLLVDAQPVPPARIDISGLSLAD